MRDVKQYLESVRSIGRRLQILDKEIERITEDNYSIGSIDYSKDRVSGGMKSDVSDVIIRNSEIIDKLVMERLRLINVREEARDIINQCSTKYQTILINRYILDLSWEAICVSMNYSWRGIFKLRDKAVAEFYRIWHKKSVH